jgi:hypothetical protein
MSPGSHSSSTHRRSTHRPALQSAGRVVYDITNGDIIHMHQTLWRANGQTPAPSHVDGEARRLAVKIGGRPEHTLAVLAADFDKLDHGTAYAVDLQTKKLVKRTRV